MSNLKLDATERTPEIDFDFETHVFCLRGESYPEDVTEFFGPIIDRLKEHLEAQEGAEITFNFELIYFNSSSAKVMMDIFDLLDEAAEENTVTVNWYHEEDDDHMEELGEEFGEDLEEATFNLKVKD